MAPLLWRVVEWHLGRYLPPDQLSPALGDLAEDYRKQTGRAGRLRAHFWLIRETLSMARAYRARESSERRRSGRTISGGAWLDDARFALRRVRRRPAAAAVSVVTLACAIGAGAVTWSLLSALLLHPLPVTSPDRLVSVTYQYQSPNGPPARTTRVFVYPEYLSIRESGIFDGLAAGGAYSLLVGDAGGAAPRQRTVYFASYDYFSTLGVAPRLGRAFTPGEDRRGAPLAAVLSDRYWRTAWNADPGVVGRTLDLLDQRATIIGVAPRGFRGLELAEAPDIYVPLHAIGGAGRSLGNPGFNPFAEPLSGTRDSPTAFIRLVGRLKPGSSPADVTTRLHQLSRKAYDYRTESVESAAIPETARASMVHFASLLITTVGLLVLIGCLTVGMLLLLRTESRRGELAMCLALGGTRVGLARGIVMEGVFLTAGGVVLALPIASWLFYGLSAFELPGRVGIDLLDLSLDRRAWLAVAGGASGALMLIVLVAGVFGFSPHVSDVLRARAGGTPRVARSRTRSVLVAAQVAIALVLLAGAGLFARSLMSALAVNTGFDAARIVNGSVSLARHGYTGQQASLFFEELRNRLDGQAAIATVSLTQTMGSMGPTGKIYVDGVPRQFQDDVFEVAVDERYFATMGLRSVEGRDFSRFDAAGAPLVVVVSESFGRILAGGGSPLGHRIADTWARGALGPDGVIHTEKPLIREVVGVVPDVITNVNRTEPLVIYYPLAQQDSRPGRTLVMKTRGDAAAAIGAALGAVRQMDPRVEPEPMLTIEERLARQMSPQRLGGFVLGALGGIAFLLTMLGAYVVAESMASGRRREFSIRAAFGAGRLRLGGLILAETTRLVGLGLIAGLVLAWMGTSTIRGFLFRVEPLDPGTLVTVAAAILGLALAVSIGPAVQAARVDLAHTLRDD